METISERIDKLYWLRLHNAKQRFAAALGLAEEGDRKIAINNLTDAMHKLCDIMDKGGPWY